MATCWGPLAGGVLSLLTMFLLFSLFNHARKTSTTTITTTATNLQALPVLWYAPFLSGGGYCSEAISFVHALHTRGIPVHIEQHGDSLSHAFIYGLPTETKQLLQTAMYTHIDPRQAVAICHSEPGAWYPPSYQTTRCPPAGVLYSIGRTMFETDRLPSRWEERINVMDEVWVPTAFQRQIFKAAGVIESKIQVVGEPVDVDFFDPHREGLTPYENIPKKGSSTFVYLSIFKWEERKGWDVLLKAYYREFTRDENVLLVILTNAYHSTADFEDKIRHFAMQELNESPNQLAAVHVLSKLPQADLPGLYKSADAFVLPSRGEGWGRPHVEAMSMGLPVIATNWSGPTEYMTSDNSYPLPYDGFSVIKTGAFRGHEWAEPSEVHLRKLLRHVFDNREEAAKKGARARRDMVRKYSPMVMGGVIVGHLDRIARNLKAQQQEGKLPTPNIEAFTLTEEL